MGARAPPRAREQRATMYVMYNDEVFPSCTCASYCPSRATRNLFSPPPPMPHLSALVARLMAILMLSLLSFVTTWIS